MTGGVISASVKRMFTTCLMLLLTVLYSGPAHMGLAKQFTRLLKNSVIPGLPQIAETRNASKKGLKVVVFLSCTTGFLWQTFSFLTVYWTYPTVVDVESEFLDHVDLPAVTVCSCNGIKSDLFCRRFPNLCNPNSSIEEFCKEHGHLCDPNYFSYGNESYATVTPRNLPPLPRIEYRDMGTKVEDIVIECIIHGNFGEINCTENFETVNVFDTTGLPNNCYAFNSLWGKTEGARNIPSDSELIFFMKAERVHSGQFYPGTPFAIQMALHSPYAILNPFTEGFSIDPCSSYYIYPSKQVNRLLPLPYSTACYNYTATWLSRSGKGPVTKKLCLEECILNKSVELAGCVDPYYIVYPNMDEICSTEPNNAEFYQICSDMCSPACEQENLSVDIQEHAHMTTEGKHEEDVCFSKVVISFSRMEVVKYTYQPKYEDISLFSYIGGYLGLWLGISLMAVCDIVETVFLITKCFIQHLEKKKAKKNKISP